MVEKYSHIMVKNMNMKDLYETGFRKKRPIYELLKIYSPHAWLGSSS